MKRTHQLRSAPVLVELLNDAPSPAGPWPPAPAAGFQDRFVQATLFRAQLHRYLAALWKRGWLILLSFLLVGAPAIAYAWLKAPAFASHATMYMGSRLNLPEGGFYAEELTSYLGTQAELIRSPTVLSRAFQRISGRFPDLSAPSTNANPNPIPFDVEVRSSTRSSTLEIQAVGLSPDATRAFVDQLVTEYLEFKRESRKQTSFSALSSITDQINQVRQDIDKTQERLTRFQASNNVSYLTESGLSAGSRLARLTEQLSDLRTEHRLLELLTPEQLTSLPAEGASVVAGTVTGGERMSRAVSGATAAFQTGYYQALQQLQLLKAKRDDFSQVLRPSHSKIIKLNQEIAGLEQLLRTLKEEGEDQARAQIASRKQSLQLQIQNLESQHRAWETNAVEASQKLAEHERMKQDLQRSQALYDRLLTLVQSVDLSKSLDQEPLSLLSAASPARRTRTHYLAAVGGVFLALTLGVGLVLFVEFFSDRFTSVRELSLHFDEDVMGQIPDSRTVKKGGAGSLLLTHVPEEHAFAESFRNLRSSLLFMPAGSAKPKIVLVTSSAPKEGKTTVSANLAATLAQAGSRVLLVDADLRRGSLHRVFEVNRKPGLWEVLHDRRPVAQAVVATRHANLFLLPAGQAQASGSELFLQYPVDQLLRDLATRFDHILIDTAPVLATDDATTLAPKTDGVLLIVRASHTSAQMAREAVDRLLRRDVKILGLVFNRAAPSSDYYCRYTRDYYEPQANRAGA